MAEVKIEHLKVSFGENSAIKDLSLLIQDKELMVIVGPSGCGKTTTLNCIAGLLMANSGSIYFDEAEVTDYPPHVRNVAMVFQSSLLYPHLNGRENIRMSLNKSKLKKEEVERLIDDAAAIVNAKDVLDRVPAQLSGGERQRVAIAKAIVRKPAVFLMDEPLANLDAALREQLRSEISVLQKRIETTMVLVTHDQVEAMTMGDRIAVMSKGELQQVGTPNEVYNHPTNTFVAQFIGSPPMHLFHGEINFQDGRLIFQNDSFHLSLPDRFKDAVDRLRTGNRVILGERPHHMRLSPVQMPQAFCASVYTVEQMGREAIAIIIDEKGEHIKVSIQPQLAPRRGDNVWVTVDEDHILLFDPSSEKNLYS
jgi:ABC-type sugar transport system ATPase subunit